MGILAEPAKQDPAKLSPEERRLRGLYTGFIDTVRIEAQGMKPAEAEIANFRSPKTLDDVAREMGSPDRLSDTRLLSGRRHKTQTTRSAMAASAC